MPSAKPLLFQRAPAASTRGFHPIRSASLASRIVEEVRAALFEGRLHPGDFIGSEKALAAQFDVSRISVRDALRTLEATGVLEIRAGAGGGARVAAANLDRFADALAVQFSLAGVTKEEILDAQWAVEGMAAELAAARATDEDKGQLRELLTEAEGYLDDPARFTECSLAFHLAVADASRNRALGAQLNALRYVVWPANNTGPGRELAERVLGVHRAIAERIEVGDSAGARTLMCQHLEGIRSKKSALLEASRPDASSCC